MLSHGMNFTNSISFSHNHHTSFEISFYIYFIICVYIIGFHIHNVIWILFSVPILYGRRPGVTERREKTAVKRIQMRL